MKNSIGKQEMFLFLKTILLFYLVLAGVVSSGHCQEPHPGWKIVKLSNLPKAWIEENTSVLTGTWIEVTNEVLSGVKRSQIPNDDLSKIEFEDFPGINDPFEEQQVVFAKGSVDGLLNVGTVKWDESKQAFVVRNVEILVAKIGTCKVLCYQIDAEAFYWARYKFSKNDDLELYLPKMGYIESLVSEKKIAGKILEADRKIIVDPTSLVDLFEDETQLVDCFEENPLTYRVQQK